MEDQELAHCLPNGFLFVPQMITQEELLDLYESMGIEPFDDNVRLRSVFVRGIDDLTEFQIEKIFAEFSPSTVEMIDGVSCNVIWHDEYVVGKMMLEMTKPLKRVRGGRMIEEGEVADTSDEEEGEMKEEHGDDVTIRMSKASCQQSEAAKATDDFVEVDVDQVDVPPDGFSYKWTNRKNRVRPGLNIFNKDGDELEWDYEHDTRFYVDLDAPGKSSSPVPSSPSKRSSRSAPPSKPVEAPKETILGKRVVKTKGRGAKRLKSLEDIVKGRGSMVADDEEKTQLEQRRRAVREWQDEESDEGDESDMSLDRDPSPTPQPWDAKRTSVRLRITKPDRLQRRGDQ
ncbi:Protein kup-1 [Toxocara canis]|uniref:Protein kup-1 n=1 Tax=Toxocara canis TaxID=6265 RepID=A0A0B2VZK4_TOXCA|nr:Protein kup-1 [Toxocara canis]